MTELKIPVKECNFLPDTAEAVIMNGILYLSSKALEDVEENAHTLFELMEILYKYECVDIGDISKDGEPMGIKAQEV